MRLKKKGFVIYLLMAALLLCGCAIQETPETQPAPPPITLPTAPPQTPTTPVIVLTLPAPTEPPTEPPTEAPTEPPTEAPTEPLDIPVLTEEEKEMLLKLAMAEVGQDCCSECAALVMRTVLNRVKSDRFGSSVRSVLYAEQQFLPIWDGSFDKADPNYSCRTGLEMILWGWDESNGALFYEFSEGTSWHSQNLKKVAEHCRTRFYQ